jgi:hypothetical protein
VKDKPTPPKKSKTQQVESSARKKATKFFDRRVEGRRK